MRKLTDHIVNPANDKLEITVMDAPGQGGASHLYSITGFDTGSNPSCPFVDRYGKSSDHTTILFQNGPINEFGVNGITHEVLLAIVADRLRSFQAGPYACNNNARALACVEEAQFQLQRRTRDRMAQGIEGTHAVGTETNDLEDEIGRLEKDREEQDLKAEFAAQDRSTDGIAAAIEGATENLE